jgi:Uma2 family endonuclease
MIETLAPACKQEVEAPHAAVRLQMLPAVPMTQQQFFDFCQQNRKQRIERTAQGELIIMPPSGGESGARNLSVGAQLYVWARHDGRGKAFDSSTGFILPNGANRSPDASWVLLTRLAELTPEQLKRFLPLCPDFLVEILSPTDSLRQTIEKMEEYIANGAQLGWLIDARQQQVHIYRPQQPAQILDKPLTLSGDPELSGFVLDLGPVWQP